MKYAIEVKNLVKRYVKQTVNAVDDVSFNVKEGEFFAFLGPNGAGKTTAISILTTILSKTSGTVMVGGYDVETQAHEVRNNIGIIFQNPSLDKNLTAEENIRIHAGIYGLYPFRPLFRWMPKEYKEKIESLSDLLGLGKAMYNPIRTFSGGMKRKLEIIRSLIHNPRVLFLDEPTTGLDPESRKNLWKYILRVRETEGTTIFLTTHYLEEAEDADNVVILNKGKILSVGKPEEIKSKLLSRHVRLKASDLSALRIELTKNKLEFEVKAGSIYIPITDGGAEIQKIIKGINTELTEISIYTPSLNDAYIDLIEGDSEKI